MKTFFRSFLISLIILLLLAIAFISGYSLNDRQNKAKSLPILDQAYDILVQHGLKDTPPDPGLEYGMIRGMVQAYDEPHTFFVEPVQHELDSNALQGSFGGIGVQLVSDPDGYWLLYPFPDSPASQAEVEDGDRLLAIDELPVNPETSAEAIQSAIRGPVGESVTISVGRAPDFAPIEIKIKRQEIPLPSVTWYLAPGEPSVGIVDINLIAASTPDEIQNAIKDLKEQGATHFILDLRDNPGGLLTAGVDIARLFLEDGIVMKQQYRGREVETHRVEKPGPFTELPLAVLINHGSASAAEIAAGALKVYQRGQLVGAPSFGKDTIQLVFDLEDRSSLHVTAAQWWIPGLEPPLGNGTGLQPDIPVDPPGDGSGPDPILLAAIQALLGK